MEFKQWELLSNEDYEKQFDYYRKKRIKYSNKYIHSFKRYSSSNSHQEILLNTKEGVRKGQNIKDVDPLIGRETNAYVYITYLEDIDKLYIGKHKMKTTGSLSKEDIKYSGSGIKIEQHRRVLISKGLDVEDKVHTYIVDRCKSEQEAFEREAHWINNMFDTEVDDYKCNDFLNLKTKYTKQYLQKTVDEYNNSIDKLKEKYNNTFVDTYVKLNTHLNKEDVLGEMVRLISSTELIDKSILDSSKLTTMTSKEVAEVLVSISKEELPDLMDTCFPSFLEKWYKSKGDLEILKDYLAFVPFAFIRESIVSPKSIEGIRVP
ncbi:hypothetical protein BT3_219 [Staphylococcus phage BT3]|uniref:Uncharacterized protein n=1 Tax=Staphylococcus phage PM22 TaxID=2813339 RepID=A0A8E5K8I3_9CAUD|nr:hypothetical protein PM9_212 [Staphylococcus phage PM9]QVD56452.1 hypothetical protein PM22_207 [Staphylococcus phage PM22]QVD56567.1 hypothetical protein PM25_110 [Staphylococcus phage PM25]QVD56683.1 hypothetical protein PM28_013 [Staphylococcus phage PM28]QVD57531.1 hypothetical protein PM32_217 [Staphylococcus phage PM32]QVD58180.1 hypothetical protein BT3_219 [Staphylococcus phage BT3]QVD58406.1 hypothetical protein PM4_213 [Staphylococcus phage PM4]UYE90413.1 hypothetical protein [S